MKKTFTILIAAIAAILMMAQPGKVLGQSTNYNSNVTLPSTGTNVFDGNVTIGSNTYTGKRIGTSKASGSITITIPQGTSKLFVHAAAWNNDGHSLSISSETANVSISPTSWTITADANINGTNSSPYTLAQPSLAPTTYFNTITVSGTANKSASIKFQTASKKRAIIWGVNAAVTVTFNGNEGSTSTSATSYTQDVLHNTETALTSNLFTRSGYTFAGWSTTSNGLVMYEDEDNVTLTGDLTLYAIWNPSLPASDLAITGSPVTLDFDLYNNYSPQTVYYTTSGTGDVTVDASDYVNTTVTFTSDTKTISVSPKSIVTPSVQTITVRQAADASHAAGTAIFSVNITNSAPSITISGEGITNNAVSLVYNDEEVHEATVSYQNTSSTGAEVKLYTNADCTIEFEEDWFDAEFSGSVNAIQYMAVTNPNNSTRTVYMRVEATINSNVIAITQGAFIPSYDVTFETDGGTFVENEDFPSYAETKEEGTYTLPSATKTNYTFAGWYDGDLVYAAGASYTISADVDFTAQWVQGGTINFGNTTGKTNINATSVSGNDSFGKTWNITTEFPTATTSFTPSSNYSQVGSTSTPATSITFTSTIAASSVTILSFSANFSGGANSSIGTVTLKVGDTPVGTGTISGTGSVTVTNTKQIDGTALTVTVTGITASIKCYSISYTFTTSDTPIIGAPSSIDIFSDITNNEFDYGILHPDEGKSLTATSTTEWISNIEVTGSKVTFDADENNSTEDNRNGTIKLSYDGAVSKIVTITQSKIDYATLSPDPFAYDEAGTSNLPTGLTSNLSGSYANSPKMKFDATGKYLVLHLHTVPSSLSYDIKGNNFKGSTFKVQTSSNGIDYDDLATYTSLGSTVQTITHIVPDGTRFIKWSYNKNGSDGGNVALGKIKASNQYDIYGTATVASLSPTSSKKCTIYNGGVLTVTGTLTNGTAANLTIKDGGQLVTSSSDVQATFEKTIAESTNNDAHWYTISSPVTNTEAPAVPGVTITSVNNLVNNDVYYNLYRYDEESYQWEAYNPSEGHHTDFTALLNGHGYLYRNNGQLLTFTGKVNVGNVSVLVSSASNNTNVKGFNLLGNPYSHNITLQHVTFADDPFTNCYILNGNGGWNAAILLDDDDNIKPLQGFMVQAAKSGNATISQSIPTKSRDSKANGDFIKFTVANNEYEDVAYAVFDKGYNLTKINHRNANIQKIYIPQNGDNFAVASMADNTQSFNLNLKAMTTGRYTLSYKAKGEFSYLHVIDLLTGDDIDMLLEGEYNFIASQNDSENRFVVRLTYAPNYGEENEIFAYQNGSDILVSGYGELQVFDVLGRFVMSKNINGSATISAYALTNGVYVLRIVGTEIKTQKIVVK